MASAKREAALKAWQTMRGPVWRARCTAKNANQALAEWAKEAGFKLVTFDSAKGNPRNGIADAVLIRIKPKSPDQVEIYLVQ